MISVIDRLVILVDTREQMPLLFRGFATERATLATGDYSCVCDGVDLRAIVSVERKSVSDLLGCVGSQRERFERELERLSRIRYRALVIEGSLIEVVDATVGRRLTPNQVLGSVLAWTFKYNCTPIFAGDRDSAAVVVATLLRHAARYALAAPTAGEPTTQPDLAPMDEDIPF
jgi:DNA excision repair protein ERCC-4